MSSEMQCEAMGMATPALDTAPGSAVVTGKPPLAEHIPGTKLTVRWHKMGRTYEGVVKDTYDRDSKTLIVVYYKCDKKDFSHDFDTDGCEIIRREPHLDHVSMIRLTAGGYVGKLTPEDGREYPLTETTVRQELHGMWLDAQIIEGGKFTHVPDGKKKKVNVHLTSKKPDCALGSVAKAYEHKGDVLTATAAREAVDESLVAKDRLAFAATVLKRCNYEPQKVKETCALNLKDEYATLLTLKSIDGTFRSHAITVFNGLIFDSVEPTPLPLTRENLTRCLGTEYGGIVRGYRFVPQKKAAKRVRDEAVASCKVQCV